MVKKLPQVIFNNKNKNSSSVTELKYQVFYYVFSTQPIAPELRKLTKETAAHSFSSCGLKKLFVAERWYLHIQPFQHVFYASFLSHIPLLLISQSKMPKQPNKTMNLDSPLARMTRSKKRYTYLYSSYSPGSRSFFQARYK